MTAEYDLGIDLGTTHTAAAVLTGGRVESVRLGTRRMEIPSTVFVTEDGGILVGEAAERRGQDEPGRLAREFKRRMGDPVPIIAGGVPFSAQALTAKLLRYVLDTVARQQDGPPSAVALTYPAHWGPYKREQLDQAIRLADAGTVRLLTEPEAVAHRHAHARRIEPGQTVAVYDLGGGTFDVAVLRREGDGFVLLGTPEGVDQLGGADFDEAVFAHMLGAIEGGVDQNDPETAPALARLRRDCVEAKESLSFDLEVTVPVAVPGRYARVRLGRAGFEAMIAPSVRDTVEATRRALRSAGVAADELTAVLLAGGSSRIPMIARVLGEEFGRPVVADAHPEHSVAIGAAWSAGPAGRAGSFPGTAATVEAAAGPAPVEAAASDATAAAAPEFTATEPAAAPATTVPNGAAPVPSAAAAPAPAPSARDWGAPVAARQEEFTGLRTAADPWAAAEAAEAAAADAEAAAATTTPIPAPRTPAPVEYEATTHLIPAPQVPHTPSGPSGRPRRKVLVAAGAAVLVLAATSGVALSYLFDERKDETKAGPSTAVTTAASVSAPAALADTPPTDTMLIRADIGAAMTEAAWKPRIQLVNPGDDSRLDLAGTQAGDTLPRWSHNREQIALTNRSGDGSTIQVMDDNGGNRRTLVGNVTGGRVAWSADDTKLAYVKQVNKVNQIFIVPVAGGGAPRQLTTSKNGKDDPVWSADGKSIIYWAEAGGVASIYELNIADPQEPGRPITRPGDGGAVDPAVSKDGKRVLFTKLGEGGNSDIWVVDTAGGGARPVASTAAREMDPSWAPDGEWFAFVRGDLDRPQIVVKHQDGFGERTLTVGGAREGHPCWF